MTGSRRPEELTTCGLAPKVFASATILANWVTTYFHLMGGTLDRASVQAVLRQRT